MLLLHVSSRSLGDWVIMILIVCRQCAAGAINPCIFEWVGYIQGANCGSSQRRPPFGVHKIGLSSILDSIEWKQFYLARG